MFGSTGRHIGALHQKLCDLTTCNQQPAQIQCPAHSTLCALVATSGCPSGPRIITPLLRLLWLLPRCHGWL